MKVTQAYCLAAVALLGLCNGSSLLAQGGARQNTKFPQQVLIIRHAEKTGEKGDIHLSKQGDERAAALHRLFEPANGRPSPFPRPDFIFAASNGTNSQRPLETVTPLATRFKLPINQRFDSKVLKLETKEKAPQEGMLALRDEIFSQPKYADKVILISWRHGTIPDLARTLKASHVPAKWEDSVYDRVWQITYDDQGNSRFLDRPQRLLRGDAEK